MSLNDILNTARDALTAQQFGLGVTGQNVANVNTPGYARRSALLATQGIAGQSFGSVQVLGVQQASDQFTDRQWFQATGSSAGADQRNTDLGTVEALFNDSQGGGLSDSLSALFNSFAALGSNPTDTTTRNTVLNSATNFAQQVSQTAGSIQQFQSNELGDAKTIAQEVNTKASQIAKLNDQIQTAQNGNQDASDLIDQRTQLVSDLSGLVDVRTFTDGNGKLVIQSSGTTLVEGGVSRTLSISTATDGSMELLAQGGSGTPQDITKYLTGGKLAGIKEARDTDATAIANSLDQFASDVANAVNGQFSAGYGSDGVGGRNLFAVSGTVQGAAASLTVDPSVAGQPSAVAAAGSASGGASDSANAIALAALADSDVATGNTRTASEAYSDIVGQVGLSKQNAATDATAKDGMKAQVTTMRDSTSGVNLDEEMVSLTQYQNAYQAASKVLTTVDQLLGDLMSSIQ